MTPEQKINIITESARGTPCRIISDVTGVPRSTINDHQRRPDIRALIEQEGIEYIRRGLKPARRTICRLAALGNKSTDPALLKLSLDASKHISTIAGLAGPAPGTIINALIQVNQVPEQGAMMTLLQEFLDARMRPAIEPSQVNMQPAIDIGENIDKSIGNTIGENIGESLCENIGGNIGENIDNGRTNYTPDARSHTQPTIQPNIHPTIQLTIQPEVQPTVHQAEVEGSPGDFTDCEVDDDA